MGGLTLWLLGRMADDTLGWVTYCAFAEIVAVLVLAVVERSLAPPQTQTKAKTKAKANSDTQSLAHAAAWKDLQVCGVAVKTAPLPRLTSCAALTHSALSLHSLSVN